MMIIVSLLCGDPHLKNKVCKIMSVTGQITKMTGNVLYGFHKKISKV